jgi:SEC-C motif
MCRDIVQPGYFMKHGDFDFARDMHANLVTLDPEYSAIFDDLDWHLHSGGPPVVLQKTVPLAMDLERSMVSGQPIVVDAKGQPVSPGKIGRNEPCPCGSGKKYKRCCGAFHPTPSAPT